MTLGRTLNSNGDEVFAAALIHIENNVRAEIVKVERGREAVNEGGGPGGIVLDAGVESGVVAVGVTRDGVFVEEAELPCVGARVVDSGGRGRGMGRLSGVEERLLNMKLLEERE